MARQTVSLEWYIGEEYWTNPQWFDGLPARSKGTTVASGEQQLAASLMRSLSLLMAAFIIVSSSALSPRQQESARFTDEIQLALSLEERAWKTDDRALYRRLVSSTVERAWLNEWRDYWRTSPHERSYFGTELLNIEAAGDLLVVDVLVKRPPVDWWSTSPYRETRIYTRTARGWLRTIPPIEFWGSAHVLETDHLRLEFYARDAVTVKNAAANIERAYLDLHQTLGLAPPSTKRKLTVAIAPSTSRGWSRQQDRIDITTPWLSRIPHDFSAEEYLTRIITNQFVGFTLNRAMFRYGNAYVYRWGVMIWAIRGWLETDILQKPSPWHVRSIETFLAYSENRQPFQLSDITRGRTANEEPDPRRLFWQYIAASSVIDYVVETYGREQVPILLQMWGTDATWDDLMTLMFQTTRQEFEAGWNRHLAKKYGW